MDLTCYDENTESRFKKEIVNEQRKPYTDK